MSSFWSLVLLKKNQKSIQNKNSTQNRNDANHFFDTENIKFSSKIGIVVEKHNETSLVDKVAVKEKTKFVLKRFFVSEKKVLSNNFNKDNFNRGAFAERIKNNCQCILTKKLNFIEEQEWVDSKKNIITYLLGLSEGDIGQSLSKSKIPIFTSSGSFSPVSSFLIQMKDGKITEKECSYKNY